MASVELPRWPLTSITSVTVYDEDSNAVVVTVADTFDVDTYRLPGRVTLKRGAVWPVALRANNAIQIVYVSGHANAAAVPAPMKRAVKQLAAYLYAHRGDDCDPADAWSKSGAESTLNVSAVATHQLGQRLRLSRDRATIARRRLVRRYISGSSQAAMPTIRQPDQAGVPLRLSVSTRLAT
jgi:hypothetical protein